MCLNLYQDIYIYIILVRPRRGSGGDVSWERERTPRIILRSGMEDCLSRHHHNELFFSPFWCKSDPCDWCWWCTICLCQWSPPAPWSLRRHFPSSCGFNHWGEYIWTGVIHVVVVEDICEEHQTMVSVSIFPPRDLSQEGPTVVSGSVSGRTEKHSRTANPPVTLRSCDGLVQGKQPF